MSLKRHQKRQVPGLALTDSLSYSKGKKEIDGVGVGGGERGIERRRGGRIWDANEFLVISPSLFEHMLLYKN